ncbi:MAG: ABC transporter ATP-binding protein, partial [Lachnospiraceae bacterium]|nr:ABC transporter ATP-binding protein [Lachnospiraceae bacterium]
MKRYMKYIAPYKTAFILCPILMMVEVLGEIVLPSLMARIINYGVIPGNKAVIFEIGGMMIAFTLFMAAGGVGAAWFGAKASINFAADLRKDAFDNVQKFSFADIDKFSTGSLVTRLTNDVTQVQNLVNMMLRMLLRAPGMLI